MKKLLFALTLACLSTAAFADGWSAGVGASVSSFKYEVKASSGGMTGSDTATGTPLNFAGYVESTYLQLAIGYRTIDGFHFVGASGGSGDGGKFTYLSFAVFGKFPIQVGPITVVPMAGVEYDFMTYGDDGTVILSQQGRSDWNSLWIKAGVGAEIPVTAVFYVRPEVLFAYQLNNQHDKDQIEQAKSAGDSNASVTTIELGASILVGIRL